MIFFRNLLYIFYNIKRTTPNSCIFLPLNLYFFNYILKQSNQLFCVHRFKDTLIHTCQLTLMYTSVDACAVIAKIGISAASALLSAMDRIFRDASFPSISGIMISIRTASYSSQTDCLNYSTASCPFHAFITCAPASSR